MCPEQNKIASFVKFLGLTFLDKTIGAQCYTADFGAAASFRGCSSYWPNEAGGHEALLGNGGSQAPAHTANRSLSLDSKKDDITIQELNQIEELLGLGNRYVRGKSILDVKYGDRNFPIYAITLGSDSNQSPVAAFVGGIHGVERIGCQVILSLLKTVVERTRWDDGLLAALENIRLLFVPVVNPVGVFRNSRSNGNGVDLMRNAPIDAPGKVSRLIGGHRISPLIYWYRGPENSAMQPEAAALCETIRAELFHAPFSIVLDCHSGFGFVDRIWFPFAHRDDPINHLPEVFAIKTLLDRTYPYLNYVFEPQAHHYLTHGDLWDYLYLQACEQNTVFLPLTLEMGSWRWIKKNPLQLLQSHGIYHPMKPHRTLRVLRRHLIFMEFLIDAVRSFRAWLPPLRDRPSVMRAARACWYSR